MPHLGRAEMAGYGALGLPLAFAALPLYVYAPKFYAEYLPAGSHEVHYFARVANAGDYLAAPATAELMYGNASHARTAADRMRIVPSSSP